MELWSLRSHPYTYILKKNHLSEVRYEGESLLSYCYRGLPQQGLLQEGRK